MRHRQQNGKGAEKRSLFVAFYGRFSCSWSAQNTRMHSQIFWRHVHSTTIEFCLDLAERQNENVGRMKEGSEAYFIVFQFEWK